ncbi:hypothetical protein FJTKL_03759 [Diaporthe vaccinii]|uniref:Uncharacterized protein n=1 Tax=Diaporthe vaccinii TaxID=105482 RepID=A0ABR4DVI2_9PEZI
MSSLLSGSDLSQPDHQPGSDAGDQDQDVATSPESLKAASGLLSTSSRDTTDAAANANARAVQLLQTLQLMTRDVTPSTDHSYRPGQPSGLAITTSREEPSQGPGVARLVKEVRNVCTEAQKNLQSLNQAIHHTPGIPGRTADLIGNDLTATAHQFITISSVCNALENKFDEDKLHHRRELIAQQASHEAYQGGLHGQLAKANMTIDEFQNRLRQIEKNSKGELEAKAQRLNEKVNNQKRRINEQQAQIETLKRKLSQGSKLSKLAINDRREDDSSPPSEFPHSATSELTYRHRRSPPVPQPKMGSSITQQDQDFLLNNLRSNIDGRQGFPPRQGGTRMERDNHFQGGPAPTAPSFGQFGHQLPGAIGPNNPMGGAPGYYGPYPPAPAYRQHTGDPTHGPPVSHHTYGMPSMQPSASLSHHRVGPSGYAPHIRPSNALVLRQDDGDDPQVTSWREIFQKLFNAVKGWTEQFDEDVAIGTVQRVGAENRNLWAYIESVASCYKNSQSTPGHAQFLLTSNDHRTKFITRLILQYLEQEVLRSKFWLGWDKKLDVLLKSSVFPKLEATAGSFDQRRVGREHLQSVVDQIVNGPGYKTERDKRMVTHAKALQDIAGSFYLNNAHQQSAVVGLHSIAKIAIEVSAKMMQSRLSFSFIWNECGVKFSHDSHLAINEDIHGYAVQYNKHMRVAIVVTPGVSYRDDNGPSIVARSLFKAHVMVMH